MELNQQEILEFVLFLVEFAKQLDVEIQSEDDLKAFADQIGEDGMKQLYAQFQQSKSATKAALGAKLNYLKHLKGSCPEGQTLKYFKKGGRVCSKCQEIKNKNSMKNSKKNISKNQAGGSSLNWMNSYWGKQANKAYSKMSDSLKSMYDLDGDNKLSQEEVLRMQKTLGTSVDGKVGNNTLSKLKLKTPQWKQGNESWAGWGNGERWKTQADNLYSQMSDVQRKQYDTDGVEGLSRDEVLAMQRSLGFTGRLLDGKIGRDTLARLKSKFLAPNNMDYVDGDNLIVGNYSPYVEENRQLPEVTVAIKRKKPVPKEEPSFWDDIKTGIRDWWEEGKRNRAKGWGVGGNGVTNSPLGNKGYMH